MTKILLIVNYEKICLYLWKENICGYAENSFYIFIQKQEKKKEIPIEEIKRSTNERHTTREPWASRPTDVSIH